MSYSLTFKLGLEIELKENGKSHTREVLLARFNDVAEGLQGITEGVLLAEEAHERGYETESWVLDEGMAPHERDWLSQEKVQTLIAYFEEESQARRALHWLVSNYDAQFEAVVEKVPDQDWNATWKAAFTGIDVNENLRVLPPWSDEWLQLKKQNRTEKVIAINPGAGFGTGTHETTQLCLGIIQGLGDLSGKTVLDFGSGSGILGIAAARANARVYCVEIDPMANENAKENAELNSVTNRIQILEKIPDEIKGGQVDLLVANILRPILIKFSNEIRDCLKPRSELVLSGLIESDLEEVIREYQKGGAPFQVIRYEKNEWRALWLRRK